MSSGKRQVPGVETRKPNKELSEDQNAGIPPDLILNLLFSLNFFFFDFKINFWDWAEKVVLVTIMLSSILSG